MAKRRFEPEKIAHHFLYFVLDNMKRVKDRTKGFNHYRKRGDESFESEEFDDADAFYISAVEHARGVNDLFDTAKTIVLDGYNRAVQRGDDDTADAYRMEEIFLLIDSGRHEQAIDSIREYTDKNFALANISYQRARNLMNLTAETRNKKRTADKENKTLRKHLKG